MELGYAICSNLCVPVEADLHLTLSGEGGAEEQALVAAEARVPRRVPLGVGTDSPFAPCIATEAMGMSGSWLRSLRPRERRSISCRGADFLLGGAAS